MRVDTLEGEALAVAVQSARTSPLVVDWYEGILTYLGLLFCFLGLNSEFALSRQAVVRKGKSRRNLRMSVLEVLDEVTSILSRKRLAFQDNLEELPSIYSSRVARGLAVLMVDVGSADGQIPETGVSVLHSRNSD